MKNNSIRKDWELIQTLIENNRKVLDIGCGEGELISKLEKNKKPLQNNILILENNTENIIEFVEYKKNKKSKKYSFWELLYND